jgi:hypothetical protein
MRRLSLLAALVLMLSGCAVTISTQSLNVVAECGRAGQPTNRVLVLMAQSVPTAALVPCVQLVPAGWRPESLNVRDGRSSFVLASDRDGPHAVTVVLTASCDVRGATRVASEQAGAARYERPRQVSSGYVGDRYYVYPGGCTTYQFDLTGTTRAEPITEASLALGFVSRSEIRAAVSRDTEGRLQLDPPRKGQG